MPYALLLACCPAGVKNQPIVHAGKAIALALGIGAGAAGGVAGIGTIFGLIIQSVARQPELPRRASGPDVARVRAHRGRRVLRLRRRPPRIRPRLAPPMLLGANALIQVVPGLMIWTLVAFVILPRGVEEVRLRPGAKGDRRPRRDHIRALDRRGRSRPRGGELAARGAPPADPRREGRRPRGSSRRRARSPRRSRSTCARRPRRTSSRRLEETKRRDPAGDPAGAWRDPQRGGEALDDRRREDHAQDRSPARTSSA